MLVRMKKLANEAKEIETDGMLQKPKNVIAPIHNGDAFSLFMRINLKQPMTAIMETIEIKNPDFPFSHMEVYSLQDIAKSWGTEVDFEQLEPQYLYEVILYEKARRPEWWDGNTCYEGGLNKTWVWREVKPKVWKRISIISQQSHYYESDY